MKPKVINVPFKGFKTHTIIYGDIYKGVPLIMLHGGPGGCIERYEALIKLADLGHPIIMYDQLGCGYSKVPKGNLSLWTNETYIEELDNILKYFNIDKYYLLGHSWGGMLALMYVLGKPTIRPSKLILYSTLPSTRIWNEDHLKMIEDYPIEQKEALIKQYKGEEFDLKSYKLGIKRFYDEHVGKKKDRKYIPTRKRFPKTNKEIYEYMWGKSELVGTGTLKDYDVEDKLHLINIPTLILSGELDESTPRMNKLMNDRILNSKWVMVKGAHHSSYNENPEFVVQEIHNFLK